MKCYSLSIVLPCLQVIMIQCLLLCFILNPCPFVSLLAFQCVLCVAALCFPSLLHLSFSLLSHLTCPDPLVSVSVYLVFALPAHFVCSFHPPSASVSLFVMFCGVYSSLSSCLSPGGMFLIFVQFSLLMCTLLLVVLCFSLSLINGPWSQVCTGFQFHCRWPSQLLLVSLCWLPTPASVSPSAPSPTPESVPRQLPSPSLHPCHQPKPMPSPSASSGYQPTPSLPASSGPQLMPLLPASKGLLHLLPPLASRGSQPSPIMMAS